jgi:hypothetical protein
LPECLTVLYFRGMPRTTQNRFTQFTSVSVTPAARDRLRKLAVELSTVLGYRVPLSEALLIAAGVTTGASDQKIKEVSWVPGVLRSPGEAPPNSSDARPDSPAS